jgi:hypothetical protein
MSRIAPRVKNSPTVSLRPFRVVLTFGLSPSRSLSLARLVTVSWRALRRAGFGPSTASSTSLLTLLVPFLRVVRPACGVFGLEGGCGVGVFRRLDARTERRSAIVDYSGAARTTGRACVVAALSDGGLIASCLFWCSLPMRQGSLSHTERKRSALT